MATRRVGAPWRGDGTRLAIGGVPNAEGRYSGADPPAALVLLPSGMSRTHVDAPSVWVSDPPETDAPHLRDGHLHTPAPRPPEWETATGGETERAPAPRVWTVGHSNRPLEDFLMLLEQARIEQVADVRRFPGSRRWPHFSGDALRTSLAERGVGYVHLAELGGRRGTPAEGSPNTGWRVPSFAAYADYMATEPFERGRRALERLATEHRTAMMCSEAVPWRCHRRLIADALLVRGWEVLDILGKGRTEPRALTEFARVRDGELTYPGTP